MGSYGLEFARTKSNPAKKSPSPTGLFLMTFAFWRRKNSWFWLEKFASFQPDQDAVLSQKVVDASQTRQLIFFWGGMGGVGVFLVGAPLAWHDIHMQVCTKIIIFFFRGEVFMAGLSMGCTFFFEFWIYVFFCLSCFLECSTFCFYPCYLMG